MEQDNKPTIGTLKKVTYGLGKAEIAANVLDCIAELVVQHDPLLRIIWANPGT